MRPSRKESVEFASTTAAAHFGRWRAFVAPRSSTGYCAPELVKLGDAALLPDAQPTFDVWSFGVVLYLLCTGRPLLRIDSLDDNLDDDAEAARLRQWRGVDRPSLGKVFAAAGGAVEDEELESARGVCHRWKRLSFKVLCSTQILT